MDPTRPSETWPRMSHGSSLSHTLTLGFQLFGRCVAKPVSLHLFPELLLQLLLPEFPELPLVSGITLWGGGQTAANQVNHNGPGLRKHTTTCWFQVQEWKTTKATLEGAREEREGTWVQYQELLLLSLAPCSLMFESCGWLGLQGEAASCGLGGPNALSCRQLLYLACSTDGSKSSLFVLVKSTSRGS